MHDYIIVTNFTVMYRIAAIHHLGVGVVTAHFLVTLKMAVHILFPKHVMLIDQWPQIQNYNYFSCAQMVTYPL